MVYDAAMPEEVHLSNTKHTLGLPPTIRALMRVKPIRDELIPHMFRRCHFHWTDSGRRVFPPDHAWNRFKRHAVPYINSLTVRFEGLVASPRRRTSYVPLERLLTWARWRSLRPHLHPWNLKNLTLVEAYDLSSFRFRLPGAPTGYEPSDNAADRFLTDVCVVPGLQSLRVVLNDRAGEEAVREFLERCASCEIDGKVGYCPYGEEKVSEWFCLQDDQVVCVDG